MKVLRSLLFIPMVLVIFSTVTADVIYEQLIKTSFPMGETETKATNYLKSDKEKTETFSKMVSPAPGMAQPQEMVSTVIVRLDKELMWILDDNAQTYTEMKFSAMKELLEEMKKMMPEEGKEKEETETPIKLEITRFEEKKKIEGYECEKVRILVNFQDTEDKKTFNMVADLWVAEEKGLLKEVADFNRKMEDITGGEGMMEGISRMIPGGMKVMTEYQEKLKELKGVPIVSELTIQAEGEEEPIMKLKIELKNIRSANLKDSEFDVPEGFKKLESPQHMEGG